MNSWLPIYVLFQTDKLEHMLALTYEFDDSQLRSIFGEKDPKNALFKMYSKKPVVIYEGTKTKEFLKVPPFIELHPIPPGAGIHHSKAYLMVKKKSIALILGSFNLTGSGFNRNRETFVKLEWSDKNLRNLSVLEEFLGLIRSFYLKSEQDGYKHLQETIDSASKKISNWKKRGMLESNRDSMYLLYSGYSEGEENQGIRRLKEIWNERISERPAFQLLVVSPFFDQDSKKSILFEEFVKSDLIDKNTEMHLITARNNSGNYPFSKSFFDKMRLVCPNFNFYLSRTRIDSKCKERESINRINDFQQLGNKTKDEVFDRPLHAKILILSDKRGENTLIYTGSANLTKNAWTGRNQELGIVCLDTYNDFDDVAALVHQMLATEKKDLKAIKSSDFSPDTPPEEDEKTIATQYPSFIKAIILRDAENGSLYFSMETRSDMEVRLEAYRSFWGDLELEWIKNDTSQYHSQEIKNDNLHQLILSRNIKFAWKEDENIYFYLPYLYTDSIAADKLRFICPDSDYWLRQFLASDNSLFYWDNTGNFEIPDEDDNEQVFRYDITVNRESNITISMQHFLSTLPAIESQWKSEIDSILKYSNGDKIELRDIWSEERMTNIAVLYRLIKRECETDKKILAAPFFKACEVLMMVGRIRNVYRSNPKFKAALIELDDLIRKEIGDLTTFLEKTFSRKKKLADKTPFKEYFNGIVRKGLS